VHIYLYYSKYVLNLPDFMTDDNKENHLCWQITIKNENHHRNPGDGCNAVWPGGGGGAAAPPGRTGTMAVDNAS